MLSTKSTKDNQPPGRVRGLGVPSYRTRLKRKAEVLLNKQGDRPLRNQQQRIINRYQQYERLISACNQQQELATQHQGV